ncbi:hypothetical protein G6O67_002216 [Ophiocordyceps sinensis]|uniref:Uncharacterized protein n=1 Tax=Ophiocordyceps sinensis TaxID=72228 RepID=A0A8H4V726_9HYPO|nr:hypothetical protein G6O67_002216 [Ophiocordyceps sinensis]
MAPAQCAVRMRGLMQASAIAAAKPLHPRTWLRHSSGTTTIVDAGFWKSLVPKPLRKENRMARSKEWNPATYFIVMFLFVGSMSIQMIALRMQTDQYARQSAVRIGLLREVVDKIRNGEEVDVEGILGTGDAQREADWEEILQGIERDDAMRKPQRQGKSKPSELRETKSRTQAAASEPQLSKTKTGGLGSFF